MRQKMWWLLRLKIYTGQLGSDSDISTGVKYKHLPHSHWGQGVCDLTEEDKSVSTYPIWALPYTSPAERQGLLRKAGSTATHNHGLQSHGATQGRHDGEKCSEAQKEATFTGAAGRMVVVYHKDRTAGQDSSVQPSNGLYYEKIRTKSGHTYVKDRYKNRRTETLPSQTTEHCKTTSTSQSWAEINWP